MDERYEAYCAVDAFFFDSLARIQTKIADFPAAARPIPEGWRREVIEDWLMYGPTDDADGHAHLPAQGWKIHVSACLDNAERVLDVVFDYCVAHGLPFKFIRDRRMLLMRNSKYARRGFSGKFATIYPIDEAELELACKELGELLDGEPGPYVLSDLRWGNGPLYVRYGGFAKRFCVADGGQVVPAIEDDTGTLVPDRRDPVFRPPSWVTLPDCLAPHLAARNGTTVVELPYDIEKVIHFSNGGGLYMARDKRTGDRVVLKEARPHAGLDSIGADAVTRLRQEREMLDRLAGLPQVPAVHDYFPVGEHEFLALEYIDGTPLNKLVVQRYPLIDADASEQETAAYTQWALDIHDQVRTAVQAIHDRGVMYGDLHLFNVMVRPDGRIVLVDFEVAAPAEATSLPALRNQAFAAPRSRSGPAVDTYAVACLSLALFLPLTSLLRLSSGKAAHFADVIAAHFPVPRPFLDAAVEEIVGPASDPVEYPTFRADREGWPDLRDQLAGAIVSSATPQREDRLFPGDIEQFRTGGLSLAYGAAGVLYALSVTGSTVERQDEYEDWLARRALSPKSGTRCGLYDGLHGVAHTLDLLGRRQQALDVLDICLRERWDVLSTDLTGGLAGIGLNLAHFAELTGESELRDAAWRAADMLSDRLAKLPAGDVSGGGQPYAGLTHGGAGAALFFIRLYERDGDPALLDRAAEALRRDLDRCVVREDGALEVNEGWRKMPYLGRGSVGIGLVLDQYLAHRQDERFATASTAISRAARAPFYAQSGLFAGRAGIILYLRHRAQITATGDYPARAEMTAQLQRLAWHTLPYKGFLAFPGEQLLRLSMDLATGTAGVLLALGAALHDEPVTLPFLSFLPTRSPDARFPEKRDSTPDSPKKEVNSDGASGPSGTGDGDGRP
jgi:hypothetical protein